MRFTVTKNMQKKMRKKNGNEEVSLSLKKRRRQEKNKTVNNPRKQIGQNEEKMQ